ncbi:cytochrome-b5 reductase [Malassezia cuniculi]|uniref:NADH-cytochrome b5 reductase 1 n=1 Tax=Malassezia cuniculi TaxID=948313 RepID=A0AAF0EPA3_9BASI|nr:cytochrome-b5 reductase [Malassezia cuniculi]
MNSDICLFIFSVIAAFLGWSFIAKVITGQFAHMNWIIAAYHDAVSFADPSVVVAFVIGISLSVAMLVIYTRGGARGLSPTEWRSYKLVSIRPVSSTTSIYRFALPKPSTVLGLPVGKHVSVRAEIGGKTIMRSYTPITDDTTRGAFELMVKSYPQGRISRKFAELKVGDSLEMKGPRGNYEYVQGKYDRIGMIAGGTGLTPCLQVVTASLRDPSDKTRFDLIYANVTASEILLMEHLDELAAKHPDRFRVYYVLNQAPAGWKGGVGFVTRDAIEKYLPAAAENGQILMCGPPPMMDAMKKILVDIGYPTAGTVSRAGDVRTSTLSANQRVFVF